MGIPWLKLISPYNLEVAVLKCPEKVVFQTMPKVHKNFRFKKFFLTAFLSCGEFLREIRTTH